MSRSMPISANPMPKKINFKTMNKQCNKNNRLANRLSNVAYRAICNTAFTATYQLGRVIKKRRSMRLYFFIYLLFPCTLFCTSEALPFCYKITNSSSESWYIQSAGSTRLLVSNGFPWMHTNNNGQPLPLTIIDTSIEGEEVYTGELRTELYQDPNTTLCNPPNQNNNNHIVDRSGLIENPSAKSKAVIKYGLSTFCALSTVIETCATGNE